VAGRRDPRPTGRRLRDAAPLVAAAVVGHFLWNSPILDLFPAHPWTGAEWALIPVATAVKGLPLLLFVVVAVSLAHAGQRRWVAEALAPEVDGSAVTAEELAVLRTPRARRRARAEMRRRAGDRAGRLLGRLQREQVNLAMVCSRVQDDGDPALARQRAICRSIRSALAAIPGALPAAGASPSRR
jgi:hypothetical protein